MFEIRSNPECVEFWSDRRLPFEPHGNMRVARDSLRNVLRDMEGKPQHALRAELVSSDEAVFDVENALTYNIGTAAFSSTASQGVHIFRTRSEPPPAPSGAQLPYLQRYTLEPLPECPSGTPAMVFPLNDLNSSAKPHAIWWAMCHGEAAPCFQQLDGRFKLHIEAPASGRNIATVAKPLLDGIISAMHPSRVIDELAIKRLSLRTGWAANDVKNYLLSAALPILPPRRVVTAYRDFIKWDPADDLCEDLVVVRSADAATCRLWVASAEVS